MRVRPLAVLLAALLLVPAACSKDDNADKAAPGGKKTPSSTKAPANLTTIPLRLTSVKVVTTGGGGTLPKRTRAGVVKVVKTYIARATTMPLRTGKRARGVPALFSAVAKPSAKGPNRRTLVDNGMPKTRLGTKSRAAVELSFLLYPNDIPSVATAKLVVKARGHTSDGTPVSVTRTGAFSLIREGNAWRIDSYDLHVERRVGKAKPKPKAAAKAKKKAAAHKKKKASG